MEYDRAGRVVKGAEKMVAKSRYDEDVLEQNHKAVWGSFWQSGQWGYACCRSFQKNSYCTGIRGIEAAEASADLMKAGNTGDAHNTCTTTHTSTRPLSVPHHTTRLSFEPAHLHASSRF